MATAQNTLDIIIPVGSSREEEKANKKLGAISYLADTKKLVIGNGYSLDPIATPTYPEIDFKPKVNGKTVAGNLTGKDLDLVDDARVITVIRDISDIPYVWNVVEPHAQIFTLYEGGSIPTEGWAVCIDWGETYSGIYKDGEKLSLDKVVGIGDGEEADESTVGKYYALSTTNNFSILIGVENKGATDDDIPSEKAVRKELNKKQDKMDIFEQETASVMWDILHYAKCYPSIKCVNAQGEEILGEVIYVNEDEIRVKFSEPESGRAYLS